MKALKINLSVNSKKKLMLSEKVELCLVPVVVETTIILKWKEK